MPAKLLNALADENPDLEKHIGCVKGIFQMFDRQHFIAGRRLNDHKHKKLSPSGHAPPNKGRQESELNPCLSLILQEKNLSKYLHESEKISIESSIASCSSSSSSSSFSSLEFNKSSQQEASSFDRTFFPEAPFKIPTPVKNTRHEAEKVKKNHFVESKESPRPTLLPKTKMPADLDEAIRILIEFKKTPWNFPEHEARETSQKTPRFSCDEERKCSAKLRELPRLSLDSRQSSQRSNASFASRTSLTLEEFDKTSISPCINRASNLLQDLSTTPRRQPGVVAKLMGLDDMPELNSEESILQDHRQLQKHNSRILNEAAPWTKQERCHSTHITKTESIDKETEEKLKGIHFRQQNKDLKALKQMVEAMRAKKLAQATKDNPKGSNQPTRAGDFPKSFESPIVIMKPAKTLSVSDPSAHSVMQLEGLSTLPKLHTSNVRSPRVKLGETSIQTLHSDKQFSRRSAVNSKSPRCLSNLNQSLGENTGSSPRTSTTLSPRLQNKKLEAEKKSQAQSTNKNQIESISPRGGMKLKQFQAHKKKEMVEEVICQSSPNPNKNRRSALQSTFLQQSIRRPSDRAAREVASVVNQKKSAARMNHQHSSTKELAYISLEQSGRASVLDASCHQDELLRPSPVKKTSNAAKEDAPSTQEKLLNATVEELQTMDFITTKCDMQNPDHKYVSDMLRATGFSNKHCPAPFEHQINPDLFGFLEKQRHGLLSKPEPDQKDRKLVFDVVSEILERKRELISSGNGHDLLAQSRRKLTGPQLLEEVCSEIEGLRNTRPSCLEDCVELASEEDILRRSEGWEDFAVEKTKVALQIERLILQDLIREVVNAAFQAVSMANQERRGSKPLARIRCAN